MTRVSSPAVRSAAVVSAALAAVGAIAVGGCVAEDAGAGVGEDGGPSRLAVDLPGPSSDSLGDGDGFIASGEAVSLSEDVPAVTRLDADLLGAVREAAEDAREDGIEAVVTSGWRSERYQRHLMESAVAEYGSREEARRWVDPPDASAHVTGDAVDIGRTDAAYWFAQHGADYGLCQIFANEVWHYELTVDPGGTCPQPKDDASDG